MLIFEVSFVQSYKHDKWGLQEKSKYSEVSKFTINTTFFHYAMSNQVLVALNRKFIDHKFWNQRFKHLYWLKGQISLISLDIP